MNLNFKPVTRENRQEALSLELAQGQEGFIESVSQCLAEAEEDKRWHPLGIYDDGQIVGFAMYGFFRREYFPMGRLWLDRLLIDRNVQGRGYGKAALSELLKLLSTEYPKKDIHGEDIMVRRP